MRLPRLIPALIAVLLLAAPQAAQARKHRPPKPPKPTSPFEWRGIVEGFYGTPWTHGDRTRIIRWMARHGFNAYVHAPKGDEFQTRDWRTPYPAYIQRNFDREIALADSNGIEWIPNISPARGRVDAPGRICFSCPGDLDTMVAKLQPFLDAGVKTVMVSFDDIAPTLGPTDTPVYSARFPGTAPEYRFGRATAEFLNALLLRLPPGEKLLTVLPDYAGTEDSPYLQGARDGALNPAIGVLWTGRRIRASFFSPEDAAVYGQLIGRTPIVWENWDTRDFVPSRLYLGPFRSRSDVAGAVQGFFFNPMNEPDLNMLPLATAGDWLMDPEHYNRGVSWRAAVTELAHGDEALYEQLRAFAETSYSSGLYGKDAPTFTRLRDAFLRAYRRGARWTDAAEALRQELALVRRARTGLRRLPDRHIARQAAPFLEAAAHSARLGQDALALLASERPGLTLRSAGGDLRGRVIGPDPERAAELRAAVASEWQAVQESPVYTYGCRTITRGCGGRPFNRMDGFLTEVTELDAEWAAQAERAARRVRLTMDDKRIPRGADGSFTLPADACGARVLATDGAGGETSLPLPPCPKKHR